MAEFNASLSPVGDTDRAATHKLESVLRQKNQINRYLSAASYINLSFRSRVLNEFANVKFRGIAPDLAVDTQLIISHCIKAQNIKIVRDFALFIVLLFSAFIFFNVKSSSITEVEFIGNSEIFIICVALTLASIIIFVEAVYVELVIVRQKFSAANWRASQKSNEARDQNVIVYSGFSPFVGAGVELASWSFAVNLEKGAHGVHGRESPRGFTPEQLYNQIAAGLERLAIGGMSLEDKLFVDGRAIRNDRRFLPRIISRPKNVIDDSIISTYKGLNSDRIRHYLLIKIVDWNGDLVTTCFTRFTKSGSQLFIEANFFVTPPLKSEFYQIDNNSTTLLVSNIIGLMFYSALCAIMLLPLSLYNIASISLLPLAQGLRGRSERNEILHNELFDYGARTTIRMIASDDKYRSYFQRLDSQMHWKVIQKQLLDSLSQFLEDHNIDASDLADRGSAIINSGIIVSGGSISAEVMAVGSGAQSKLARNVNPQGGQRGNAQ
ncbi:hypothetical protein ACQKLX_17235 [Bosea sp. NPDC003192]|uniref:hypothetical protein n=1 Tax=Bosea sp. NPDC003192 TaxID=3390551 RepID=UPI003D074F4C